MLPSWLKGSDPNFTINGFWGQPGALATVSKNHRFPGEIISHGGWLYYRFPLSYRDVQELLFARGIDVTHEAIRQWCLKFG